MSGRERQAATRGSVLLGVVVLVAVLVGLSSVTLALAPSSIRAVNERAVQVQARYDAMSAASRAQAALASQGVESNSLSNECVLVGPTPSPQELAQAGGFVTRIIDDALLEAESLADGESLGVYTKLGDGAYFLVAGARRGGHVQLLANVLLERAPTATFCRAAFAGAGIDATSLVYTDSYDSAATARGKTTSSAAGSLGSNGSITLGLGTVKGDVTPGPDGALIAGEGLTVTGSSLPAAGIETAAPVSYDPPALFDNERYALVSDGALSITDTYTEVPAGTYVVDQLVVDKSTVVIGGDTTIYVSGEATLDSSTVLLAAGATLNLVVLGDVSIGGGATIMNDGPPSHLQVQKAGPGTVQVGGGAPIKAVIRAPQATVQAPGALELYGAIIADVITTSSPLTIHFDEALLRATASPGRGEPPSLAARWWVSR